MKFVFSFILIIHGLIHLLGYAKAFYITNSSSQVLGVSKPIGSIWLVTFIMFIVATMQYLTNKKWFYVAFVAVLVSQVLILLAWKEAKFGTIANIIILIVSISAYATNCFNTMVESESKQILQNIKLESLPIISENDIAHLPKIVQKWITNSGVIGIEKVNTVRLKQVGKMRTNPNGNWMSFEATQYFNVENPAFIWNAKVDAMLGIKMLGRDELQNGKGKMLIKLGGVIPVVNESENSKINSGAMIRYLAEICWFPSTALKEYITWNSTSETSAKATFSYNNQSVSGVFLFSENGDFVSFTADRYYGGDTNSTLETWYVEAVSYKEFNGVKIPNTSKVTWKLPEGDFNWLNLEITDIEFNPNTIY